MVNVILRFVSPSATRVYGGGRVSILSGEELRVFPMIMSADRDLCELVAISEASMGDVTVRERDAVGFGRRMRDDPDCPA